MGQAGPVLLEVKIPSCSWVKPPGDTSEVTVGVYAFLWGRVLVLEACVRTSRKAC